MNQQSNVNCQEINSLINKDNPTKICSKCKEEKSLRKFDKDKNHKGGFSHECKSCKQEYRNNRLKNQDKILEEYEKYRLKNPIYKKICPKCKIEKDISKFTKRKTAKDGLDYECSDCRKEENKIWRSQLSLEEIKEQKIKHKKYYDKNRDDLLLQKKQYGFKNRDKISVYIKQWDSEHKEEKKIYNKQYNAEHKDEIIVYRRIYEKNRRKTKPEVRIISNLRSRMNTAYKSQGVKKIMHIIEGLGCTVLKYQQHLQSHFKPGMTLKNDLERKWIQHHPIELNSVDLSNIEELKRVCHYTNVVPMWEDEHIEWHRTHPFKSFKKKGKQNGMDY